MFKPNVKQIKFRICHRSNGSRLKSVCLRISTQQPSTNEVRNRIYCLQPQHRSNWSSFPRNNLVLPSKNDKRSPPTTELSFDLILVVILRYKNETISHSLKRRQYRTTLRTSHLNLHPRNQTTRMVSMFTWSFHQSHVSFNLRFNWVRRINIQRCQTNWTLILLISLFKIHGLLITIIINRF